jgi:protein-disulfide isomerase
VNGQLTPPLEPADHVQGSPGAPLELVMFSDFQCPYCRTAQDVVRRLGLDAERVAQELANGRWRERVARDVWSAIASGVPGTPTFFVNGRRHDDAYDADVWVAALEADPPTSSGNPSAGRDARTLSRQA